MEKEGGGAKWIQTLTYMYQLAEMYFDTAISIEHYCETESPCRVIMLIVHHWEVFKGICQQVTVLYC